MNEISHIYHRNAVDPDGNDSLAKIARQIAPATKVLDVGCAVGRLGQHLSETRHCIVDGIEINPEAAALARPHYRDVWELDVEDTQVLSRLGDRRYDIVVCADILEHLRDPTDFLRGIKPLLTDHGRLLVSVPNIAHGGVIRELLSGDFRYRDEGLLDRTHLRFFTRQSFLRTLAEAGWRGQVVDHTVLDIQYTEFAQPSGHHEKIPQLLWQTLLPEIPDAAVYQFVVEAVPEEYALPATPRKGPDPSPPRPSVGVAVYWRDVHEHYSETRRATRPLPLGSGPHTLRLRLPGAPTKRRLRIDPGDWPCYLRLHELALYRGPRALWVWDGRRESLLGESRRELSLSPGASSDAGAGLWLWDDDSWIELAIPEELVAQADTLEARLSAPPTHGDALGALEGWLALCAQDPQRPPLKQLQAAQKDLAATRATLQQISTSRSWRLTEPLRRTATRLRAARQTLIGDPSQRARRRALAKSLLHRLPLPERAKDVLSVWGRSAYINLLEQDYALWVRRYDTLTDADRGPIRRQIASWTHPPMISVIMPVYNAPPRFLQAAIDSVRHQLYPHWELCIADDASPDPRVRRLLQDYAKRDARIRVHFRAKNGHISRASNDALAMASGEFIALLDHDDLLAEHALYWVAAEILRHPHVDLLYSDEDKVDAHDTRSDAYFKPDWNPDLLLGQNYVSHLGVYRRERVLAIGGFRAGYEGSQDWDLVLRFTTGLDAHKIRHIPAVLYHWRTLPNSTAASLDAKPYCIEASRKAVQEFLSAEGACFAMDTVCNGVHHRPRLSVKGRPTVSLIIPTRNGVDVLRTCLESLERTHYPDREIVIIDNQSDDPETLTYLASLKRKGRITLLRYDAAFNYAHMHNWAVPQCSGEFLCLLNNDTEAIAPEWLTEMVAHAQRPEVGAVGAKLLYPDGTVQHGGVALGIGGIASHLHKHVAGDSGGYFGRAVLIQTVTAVTGACLVMRKQHWEALGGMSENLPVAFNDVDLCLRLREAGYRNVWVPQAVLYHHESKSRGDEQTPANRKRFASECAYMQWRWGPMFASDPGYNPNLSLDHEQFGLAKPPRAPKPWHGAPSIIDVPYGAPNAKPDSIDLRPDTPIEAHFAIPHAVTGTLHGLDILVGTCAGPCHGTLVLTIKDGMGHTVEARGSLAVLKDDSTLPLPLDGEGLALMGQEGLTIRMHLEDAVHPLALYAYPVNARWSHGITGHDDMALRIRLHVTMTTELYPDADAVRRTPSMLADFDARPSPA